MAGVLSLAHGVLLLLILLTGIAAAGLAAYLAAPDDKKPAILQRQIVSVDKKKSSHALWFESHPR
jgi:hypothetical protein